MEHNAEKRGHRMNPSETQQFEPVVRDAPRTETNEYHSDITHFIDLLNRDEYTLMGQDGFIRTGLKVQRLDKDGDTWRISLYNPHNIGSTFDTLTVTLGEFETQRQRTVIER